MLLVSTPRQKHAFQVTVVSASTLSFLRTTGHKCGEIQISLGKQETPEDAWCFFGFFSFNLEVSEF